MKGYYIHFDGRLTPGVSKKIDMQIAELRRHFETEEIEIKFVPKSLIHRIFRLLPGGGIEREYEQALKKIEAPDYVYIRRTLADRYYVRFLREIRNRYPKCIILIEIFTYPYDRDEFDKWYYLPLYLKERWNRRKVSRLIDRYVTLSEDKVIFDRETICITNGICVDNVKLPTIKNQKAETVDLIAVAYMQKQHGYERLIEGMKQYYDGKYDREINLHLVGEGPEKKKYAELVERYRLQEHVFFYPFLTGEELDKVYDGKDIAVAALGLYKNNIYWEGSLKTREYLAKGIPILTGCTIDVFDRVPSKFHIDFENNDSAIDMKRVVEFYEELRKLSGEAVQREIREYAEHTVDMKIAFKPVIEYLMDKTKKSD